MDLGDFLIFNAICDMVDKPRRTELPPDPGPMPLKVIVACIFMIILLFAAIIIIACTF